MRVVSQKCNDELASYCNIPFENTGFTVTKENDHYKILAYVYGAEQPYHLGSYKKEEYAIFVSESFEAFKTIAGTVYLPPEKVLLDSFNAVGEGINKGTATEEEINEEVKRLFTTNYWLGGKNIV